VFATIFLDLEKKLQDSASWKKNYHEANTVEEKPLTSSVKRLDHRMNIFEGL
jgi:glutathione synthase/RimK-type ligase-like ATP-grasp enzyme